MNLEIGKNIEIKNTNLTVIKIVGKVMCGLVVITSLVVVFLMELHGMKGILWFPIIVGFLATIGMQG